METTDYPTCAAWRHLVKRAVNVAGVALTLVATDPSTGETIICDTRDVIDGTRADEIKAAADMVLMHRGPQYTIHWLGRGWEVCHV